MEAETKKLNKGQLILIPTDAVDELLNCYEDLVKAKTTYSASNHSIRSGRKLRKLLLSIQKTATTARAEVLTRRKMKQKSKKREELDEVFSDPAQTSLKL